MPEVPIEIQDWLPQEFWQGPPLPEFLHIYWPWYKPPGAEFRVSGLTISPEEVNPGQPVTISCLVENIGTEVGTKTVVCKVEGEIMAEQTVELAPGESRMIAFEAVPHEARTYQVVVDGLSGSFAAIAPPFYWLRPTGHVPGRWNDEELAYDGLTDTRAEVVDVGTQSWSPYLELTIEPTEISAVRWWGSSPITPRTVQVDVRHYDGTYHNIYEGGAVVMWDDGLPIPGGARVISGARIRFYNPARTVRMKFRVNEFEFYGAGEPPEPPIPPPATKLYGRVTNKITGAPIASAIGTVYQDYDTHTKDYDFTTDAQGYYLIDNMLFEVNVTKMVVYANGYETYTNENISISEGDNQLNVRMEVA